MRGELDDTLARLARREEVLRKRAAQIAAGDSPVDEVTDAVARLVARNPELAVTMSVSWGSERRALRIAWSDEQVTVTPVAEPAGPTAGGPPSWPMSVKTVPAWAAAGDGLADDSAARLADLIRHDPSLLGGNGADEEA